MQHHEIKDYFPLIIHLSHSVKREMALCLADDGQTLVSFGEKHSGDMVCPTSQPKVMFHTHPSGVTAISQGDIDGLANSEIDINHAEYCIGAMENAEPTVNCLNVQVKKGEHRVVFYPSRL